MLSIVIPTLNRPQPLVKLVQSLEAQKINQDYEILVVYNQSSEAARSPLKNKPNIKIFTAPSPGVNHSRNWGAQNALGEIVLFIDDDCIVDDRLFVQKHIDAHLTDDKTPAFGGPYKLARTSSLWDQIYHLNNLNWIESNKMGEDRSFALLGGNTSYKAAVFKKGLRFTEEITYGGSETPLNTLLSLKYGPLGYLQDTTITHDTNLSFFKLIRKAYKQGLGAAIQTKLYGHQLRQTMEITNNHPLRYRLGLELYAFVFMLGYKSQISQRQLIFVFFQELWSRYILQKKEDWTRRYQITQDKYVGEVRASLIKVYWWQRAQIRHPLYMFLNKAYWFSYSILSSLLGPITGFLFSLLEPLNEEPKHFLDLINKRFLHIGRKFAWLLLKAVGAR
ncbi:glycosyltransferase family 2 protein [bacterium]|nr:glycosyltransferase family 2 protein [bacterium]